MTGALRAGVVGAGKISAQYGATLLAAGRDDVVLTAVSDLDEGRAMELAGPHGARVLPTADLVAADDVDVVLDLTIPALHERVTLDALAAGKHVYGEKPLALDVAAGRRIADAATGSGLRVGCAPDTVLGSGVQTARALVESGAIGAPHAATAFMTTPGHERWHPDPEFYYRPGGGPLLDMGPYYVTALVHLLGPVSGVVGLAGRRADVREIGSGPRAGTRFDVEVDTHVTGVLQHESGALSTLLVSFDTWAARLPRIEVYGASGTVSVPDPNHFEGPVSVFTAADPQWRDVRPTDGWTGLGGTGRGIGLLDLARALASGTEHRASLEVALHVLDVMESLLRATSTRRWQDVSSTCRVPDPVKGLVPLT